MCSGGGRVTFYSVRMRSLWPARTRCLVNTETGLLIFKKKSEGSLRGDQATWLRELFHQGSTLLQSRETNSKINTPTQDSSLQGPPSAQLSVRISTSSRIGTADKLGVRAHWSYCRSATKVLFSTTGTNANTDTNCGLSAFFFSSLLRDIFGLHLCENKIVCVINIHFTASAKQSQAIVRVHFYTSPNFNFLKFSVSDSF